MELFVCQPHEIDRAWRDGADMLGDAIKHAQGEVTLDQLKMLLSRNERTLIGLRDETGVKGWAAVGVQQLPNIRVMHVYAMAGKGICTVDGFDLLKQYAVANGCSSVRGAVRAAVMRMMQQRFGATPLYQTFEVSL
jgi:hypothetical protein